MFDVNVMPRYYTMDADAFSLPQVDFISMNYTSPACFSCVTMFNNRLKSFDKHLRQEVYSKSGICQNRNTE